MPTEVFSQWTRTFSKQRALLLVTSNLFVVLLLVASSMSISGSVITGLTSSSSSVLDPADQNFHATPSTNFTFADSTDEGPISQIAWIAIIVVASLVFLTFLGFAIHLEKRRFVASRLARRTADASARRKRKPPSERYLEIEKWLVSKRVEAHDETCDNVLLCSLFSGLSKREGKGRDSKRNRQRSLTDNTSKTETDHSHSVSSDIEDGHLDECPICFDVFEPGEIVSWSPAPNCQHVFHHHCIKEWLLKKKECPFCRETFLPIDRIQGNMNLKKINELILAQQHRSAHSFYCVKHGVVRPPNSCVDLGMKKCEVDAIVTRSQCVPTLEELQQIRGVADCSGENIEDTLHSVPGGTALSSVDENSEIEIYPETEDMQLEEDSVTLADNDNAIQNETDRDHDDSPFCLEVSENFPDSREDV